MCKLLGHLGVNPEYRRGVIGFPEFLQSALEDGRAAGVSTEYIEAAMKIKLERQVGSRYFVTSRNAGRIFFLAPCAAEYLRSLERTKELERDVLRHMSTDVDRALLKADGIFFDAIYADLMCLLKSRQLNKTYLDMNQHYLELLERLQLYAQHP